MFQTQPYQHTSYEAFVDRIEGLCTISICWADACTDDQGRVTKDGVVVGYAEGEGKASR
jgi:hypothetical protein